MAGKERPLTVVFTNSARADWIAIWEWNAVERGVRRADFYMAFLETEILRVAQNPRLGAVVEEYPGLRRRLAKKRSHGHGHIVFFRVVDTQLEVVHIYHTAQDWRSKLEDE